MHSSGLCFAALLPKTAPCVTVNWRARALAAEAEVATLRALLIKKGEEGCQENTFSIAS